MVKSVNIKQFLKRAKQSPVIDVRSPKEFENGHIPGAVNIPLFNNMERAKVGTTYKQSGREQAILLGLEIAAPKMTGFVKKVERIAHSAERMAHGVPLPCAMRNALLYCWRGGMRSENFAWLLDLAGFEVFTLKNGYKSFRKFILENFDKDWAPRTSNNQAVYSNLPSGSYTFKVESCNNDGFWNREPATFSFTITDHPLKTKWAYGIYILTVIAGIFLFIKLRERNLIRTKQILEEKIDLRTKQLQKEKEKLQKVNIDLEKLSIVANKTDNSVIISDANGNIE